MQRRGPANLTNLNAYYNTQLTQEVLKRSLPAAVSAHGGALVRLLGSGQITLRTLREEAEIGSARVRRIERAFESPTDAPRAINFNEVARLIAISAVAGVYPANYFGIDFAHEVQNWGGHVASGAEV